MALVAVALVILVLGLFVVFSPRRRRQQIPEDYRALFEYYDVGYEDQKAGRPKTDWSKILETKDGSERVQLAREIKAYNLGHDEASEDKQKRTQKMRETNEEHEQLWKELTELLD